MRIIILGALLAALASPALAQGSQSASDIMRSLRPRGDGGDRGIGVSRPALQTPAPPAPMPSSRAEHAATPPHPPAAQPAPASPPSVNLSVLFRTGSAELTPDARRTLGELGKALSNSSLTPYRFRIEGHTDTVGDPAVNRALSERRAVAVVEYLNAHFGVDRARLEAVGMGEDAPLVLTGPQVPEPRNRRVQVVNLGA